MNVLDDSFLDLVPFVFPAAYLVALAILHVSANVRPSHALLKERYALLQAEYSDLNAGDVNRSQPPNDR